jgi:hypothetical protein
LHNLRWLSAAIRAQWLWFQRTSDCKPWSGLQIDVSGDAQGLYQAATRIVVGSGEKILFWVDPWIHGHSAATLAPALIKLVRPGLLRSRTVQQGKENNSWVLDIAGPLTIDAVVQFLQLWPQVQAITTIANEPDSFSWKFSASGAYSTRETYLACFAGRTALPAAREVRSSFAPLKHKFFGWLAIQDRCWTLDRLARRGLPNNSVCPLCGTIGENINHLLLQCPFARGVWFRVLRLHGLQRLNPSPHDVLADWWPASTATVAKKLQRDLNSLCLLTMRAIWLERSAWVFDNATCTLSNLVTRIKNEWPTWVTCRGKSTRVFQPP